MPSEQARGKPKLCSDIYAVGMIGIQALTGVLPEELPEDLNTGNVIWRNLVQVDSQLADLLDKMVCDRFSQRYQSAAEALQALAPLLRSRSSSSQAATGIGTSANSSSHASSSQSPPQSTPNLSTFNFTIITVNARGEVTNRLPGKAQYFEEDLGGGVTLEMVVIPSGTFLMGSPTEEIGRIAREEPQHSVTVPYFFMGNS